jgi:sugar lactone lactonase YvrE
MRDFGVVASGALYRIDDGRSVSRIEAGLRVPNGLAWSPDDRVLYFTDTVSQVTSCAFGDADLRTLYITSARQRLTDAQVATQPDAGSLFAVCLAVGGLPEPECRL